MYVLTAPLTAALWALVIGPLVQAGPVPKLERAEPLIARYNHHDHHDGVPCWRNGREGLLKNGICVDLDLDVNVDVHKRSLLAPHRFSHYYPDRTPCWVDGHRGWFKDQTCGDLVDIDASIKIGKRFHSFDDPYFANGVPCFHHGRQGLLQDLICAVVDVDVGHGYDNNWSGPWRFNKFYDEGRPCWVDNRRGYIHDQTCGNLLDIDADLSIAKRFYKDDPYFFNGVPCFENGREGILNDYICLAADVQVAKRGYWGYYGGDRRLVNGAPCWQDGREGIVGDLLCVVADVHVGKRGLGGPPDGDACFKDERWGAFRDGICIDLDIDADVVVDKRELLGLLGDGEKGGLLGSTPDSGLLGSGHNGRLLGTGHRDGLLGVVGDGHRGYPHHNGHYVEDDLVDATADITIDDLDHGRGHILKRSFGYYDPDELMAEIQASAEINADNIQYTKRHFQHGHGHKVADLDVKVKADLDLDAGHRHGHHGHKRSGLLNNKNGVKGAVESIGKTTHNALGKRESGHGHQYDHDHKLVNVDADIKVGIDGDHHGHHGHRYRAIERARVARGLLGSPAHFKPTNKSFGKGNRVQNTVSKLLKGKLN